MHLRLYPGPLYAYGFFAGLLAFKFLLMSILTTIQRFRKSAFATPEDVRSRNLEINKADPDVERVRSAHLNDMENILPFFFIGFFFCFTDPGTTVAAALFLVFTIVRYLHTFVYAIYVVRQPARAVSFTIGYFINIYMTIRIIITFAEVVTFDNDKYVSWN